MNINLLQSFISVIECHSLTKAARQLHLTQPAVTKHLQSLEEKFGTRLIDRNSESRPTPEGDILYKYAKLIIDAIHKAEQEIEMLADNMQGKLSVCASTIPGQYLMPKVLGLFKTKYPNTEISLQISASQQVINKVLEEEILVGAIGTYVQNPKLHLQEFFRDTLIFIASPSSPFSHKRALTIHELNTYPFIWREKGSGTRKASEELLKAAGYDALNLNIIMELNATEGIITAVESGLGISLISHCAAQRALDSGSLIKLDLNNAVLERKLYLVTLKTNLKRKLVSAFFEEADIFAKSIQSQEKLC